MSQKTIVFFVLLSPLVIFALILIPYILLGQKRKKAFRELIHSLGGEMIRESFGMLTVDGQKYFLQYFEGSRNQPSFFSLSAEKASPAALIVRKEKITDRLFKNIGLNQEIQLQDPDFNESVYLDGEDQGFVQQLFSDYETRQATKRLLVNFPEINFQKTTCFLKRSPSGISSFLTLTALQETIRDFFVLLKALPDADPALVENQKSNIVLPPNSKLDMETINSIFTQSLPLKPVHWVAIKATGVAFIVAIVLQVVSKFFPLVNPWSIWPYVVSVATILSVVLFLWFFQKIKGHPDSARTLGLSMCFSISSCIITAISLITILNAYTDKSPLLAHACVVTSKYVGHSSENGNTYHISLAPWNPQQNPYKFTVSRREYETVTPNQTQYQISTKKGNFGFEWVASRTKIN